MKVSLNFEKTSSSDVSIIVDTFRASTTITVALNKFNKVIPTFSPNEAKKIAMETSGILAGERNGVTLEGFDVGNSPVDIKNYESESNILVLTTSNGTRILENMNSKVLIGCFINAESVAKSAIKIAKKHIDVVMAGWKGNFALEDFLASGEILYWIEKELNRRNNNLKGENTTLNIAKVSEYGQSAILASRNYELVKKTILNTRSAKKLKELGFKKDVELCLKKNTSKNVAIYKNGTLKLLD